MTPNIPSNIGTLLQIRWNFYLTDVLDILIIATLLYSLFVLFRKTRTSMVFLGLLSTGVLYLLASFFNLYLTLILLRYLFGVSLILLVVIFQGEIRKYFEYIGASSAKRLRSGKISAKLPEITHVIQSCVQMAQTKTGVLIVILGQDNVEPYIEGGVDLDGIVSEELIHSIFDPSSDGHDGAMIINNSRVVKFGAHLPLSTNFKDLGKKGTRHSAALGLSEVTDALCIVVSEEKGVISICRDGKIKELTNYSDLEKILTKFVNEKFKHEKASDFYKLIRENTLLKIAAIFIASIIWYFAAYKAGIVENTYSLPLKFENAPENVFIESYSPKEISITVSGRGNSAFKDITAEDFRHSIDVSNLQDGLNKKHITNKNLSIPNNLVLVGYEPENVLLTATKYNSIEVPINIVLEQDEDDSIQIIAEAAPEKIRLLIPQSMKAPTQIDTETIDLKGVTDPVIVSAELIIPDGIKSLNGSRTTDVAITFKEIYSEDK